MVTRTPSERVNGKRGLSPGRAAGASRLSCRGLAAVFFGPRASARRLGRFDAWPWDSPELSRPCRKLAGATGAIRPCRRPRLPHQVEAAATGVTNRGQQPRARHRSAANCASSSRCSGQASLPPPLTERRNAKVERDKRTGVVATCKGTTRPQSLRFWLREKVN